MAATELAGGGMEAGRRGGASGLGLGAALGVNEGVAPGRTWMRRCYLYRAHTQMQTQTQTHTSTYARTQASTRKVHTNTRTRARGRAHSHRHRCRHRHTHDCRYKFRWSDNKTQERYNGYIGYICRLSGAALVGVVLAKQPRSCPRHPCCQPASHPLPLLAGVLGSCRCCRRGRRRRRLEVTDDRELQSHLVRRRAAIPLSATACRNPT